MEIMESADPVNSATNARVSEVAGEQNVERIAGGSESRETGCTHLGGELSGKTESMITEDANDEVSVGKSCINNSGNSDKTNIAVDNLNKLNSQHSNEGERINEIVSSTNDIFSSDMEKGSEMMHTNNMAANNVVNSCNDNTNLQGSFRNILSPSSFCISSNAEHPKNENNINNENEMTGDDSPGGGNNSITQHGTEAMITDEGGIVKNTATDDDNSASIVSELDANKNSSVEVSKKDQHSKTDAMYQKDLSSLKLLCDYGSDSDEDNDIEQRVEGKDAAEPTQCNGVLPTTQIQQNYRTPGAEDSESDSEDDSDSSEEETSSSSTTASSSSSSDDSEESDNSSETECVIVEEKKPSEEPPRTRGELGLEDLPPIEELHISVPESECVEIGKVLSIVDTLVVVQSIKGLPALDLDSVLFLDNGHNALGQVFDVLGKVGEACYCVRFNSKDHAISRGVEVGMPVYYAPRTEHSRFIFLADLLKMKGSDASWEHNNEPPEKFLDYSDDEEERRARKGNKPPTRDVEPDETQPRTKKFNRRPPQSGGPGRNSNLPRPGSGRPWATPFNRFPCPSPSPTPSPRSGPQPLIRPPAFQTPPPSSSHFHNEGAGAPAVPPIPSPWAVPPPAVTEEFSYVNIPPPQSFIQHHTAPNCFNANVGGFGQPPPPPPPPSPSSRNFMLPTSIPGTGPFGSEPLGGYVHRPDTQSPFRSSRPPFEFSSLRPSQQDSSNASVHPPFGPHGPVFPNRNMPPPPPPPHGW